MPKIKLRDVIERHEIIDRPTYKFKVAYRGGYTFFEQYESEGPQELIKLHNGNPIPGYTIAATNVDEAAKNGQIAARGTLLLKAALKGEKPEDCYEAAKVGISLLTDTGNILTSLVVARMADRILDKLAKEPFYKAKVLEHLKASVKKVEERQKR